MTDAATPGDDPGETDAGLWTWPNAITLARLLCIPLFVWLLFVAEDRAAAAALLAVLGATDWVDGYIARRTGQVSEIGKILDPTADRMLFFVAITSMLIDGSVPVWFAVLTLLREGLVAAATLTLGAIGVRRIDVTWWGKTATFGLMVAFPLFLAADAGLSWSGAAEVIAYVVGVPSLVLSYYSAFLYIPIARRALAEHRAAT